MKITDLVMYSISDYSEYIIDRISHIRKRKEKTAAGICHIIIHIHVPIANEWFNDLMWKTED